MAQMQPSKQHAQPATAPPPMRRLQGIRTPPQTVARAILMNLFSPRDKKSSSNLRETRIQAKEESSLDPSSSCCLECEIG